MLEKEEVKMLHNPKDWAAFLINESLHPLETTSTIYCYVNSTMSSHPLGSEALFVARCKNL